jgi:hypothetical protein
MNAEIPGGITADQWEFLQLILAGQSTADAIAARRITPVTLQTWMADALFTAQWQLANRCLVLRAQSDLRNAQIRKTQRRERDAAQRDADVPPTNRSGPPQAQTPGEPRLAATRRGARPPAKQPDPDASPADEREHVRRVNGEAAALAYDQLVRHCRERDAAARPPDRADPPTSTDQAGAERREPRDQSAAPDSPKPAEGQPRKPKQRRQPPSHPSSPAH